MRILVVTDQWSPDVIGGSARVAAATARLLAERGHEVTVVAPSAKGLPRIEADVGLHLHRSLRRVPLPQTFGDVAETWRWVARSSQRPDVVLAHQATTAAGVLAARIEAPLVLVLHASAPLEQRFLRKHLSWPRRFVSLALEPAWVWLERLAVSRAASILVLSEFSRRLIVQQHPAAAGRIVVVRGGVDPEIFVPAARAEEVRRRLDVSASSILLLTVRRLEPRMGLEELLRAVWLLGVRGVPVTLAIAGDGMQHGQLVSLARSLEIEDRVRFLGRVPEQELPRLYASADLFVLPTVAYEGFGMATVEALASGTPVVGTPIGATPELLAPLEPRLVAASVAPADLANAIAEAVTREGVVTRGHCVAYARERFDWRSTILDWERSLEAVVACA